MDDKQRFKEWVIENFNALDEDTQKKIKANGFTIDKIVSDFTRSTIEWDYLANYNDYNDDYEEDNNEDNKEYYEELNPTKQTQYNSLLKAVSMLSDEEQKIFKLTNTTLSYLADIYDFNRPKSTDEALEILRDTIKRYLDKNKPYYEFSKEQIEDILTEQGLNPNKSKMLNNNYIKEQITNDFNDYQIDKTKPLTYTDLDEKVKEEEGLNYKYLLFSEEYIKRNGNIKATCEYIGIGRATAYRWLELDEVKDYLKKREDEITTATDNTFKNTYNECFNELNKMITNDNLNRSDKIKAIDTFLKHYENIERLKQLNTLNED